MLGCWTWSLSSRVSTIELGQAREQTMSIECDKRCVGGQHRTPEDRRRAVISVLGYEQGFPEEEVVPG